MREKIERLSKGIFEYDEPELVLSDNALDLFVQLGDTRSGSFSVSCSSNRTIKGILYSSSPSLKLLTTSFVGIDNEIAYEYNAEALEEGKQIKGIISVISDCGEKQLPFTISASSPALAASIGYIGDLQSFTLLAQTDWREATELFFRPNFYDIIIKGHEELEVAYKVFTENMDRNQALEQFLVSVGKKEESSFNIDTVAISADATENFVKTVIIKKTNWGYTGLQVESSNSYFVNPLKTEISSEDFVNGQFELKVMVYPTRVKPGTHTAFIRVYNQKKEIKIPVSVKISKGDEIEKNNRRNVKRYLVRIYQQYIKFRLGDIQLQDFISESRRYVESALLLLDKLYVQNSYEKKYINRYKSLLESYSVYLLLSDGNSGLYGTEALNKILQKSFEAERDGSTLYPVLLYLEAMSQRDFVRTLSNLQSIRNFYNRVPMDDLGLWMIIHMDPELEDNDELKFKLCYDHLKVGNCGTLILYEAAAIIRDNPTLLTCTNVNWRILSFMNKHNMLTMGVASAAVQLVADYKDVNEQWLSLLISMKRVFDSEELLKTICSLVVKLDLKNKKYHHFLELGIKKKFDIPNLYEYYLYTYGEDIGKRIEPAVFSYFSFDNQMPEDIKATLFAYIVSRKAADNATYTTYLKQIREFTLNELRERRISDNLSVLYQDILSKDIIEGELKDCIPDVLFSARVECRLPGITSIFVKHSEENEGHYYDLINGRADVYIYSSNVGIFLVDSFGEKYARGKKVLVTEYLKDKSLLTACYDAGSVNPRLSVYLYDQNLKTGNREYLSSVYRQLSSFANISESIRAKCSMWLAEYHYDNYNGEMMESYLRDLKYEKGGQLYRGKLIEMMIMRNMYDEALNLIFTQGCENVDEQALYKLCRECVLKQREPVFQEKLVFATHQLFRKGVFNDELLQYLCQFFVGTTIEMYELWNKAYENGIETTMLEENLLAQMLFANSYIEYAFSVFKSFYFKQKNRTLIRAYLSLAAYNYFVRDIAISNDYFDILKSDVSLENSRICILALLKYYSEKPYLTEDEIAFSDTHIRRFLQDKMFFKFYEKFENKLQLPAVMYEKDYIEFRANPLHQVSIHYAYGDDEEFIQENMIDMGYGIFTKEVILFKNESFHYLIVESDGENTEIKKKDILYYSEKKNISDKTKYGEINEIITSVEQEDYKKIVTQIEQYYLTEYAMKRHFTPI